MPLGDFRQQVRPASNPSAQNIVATATFTVKLPIRLLAERFRAEYNERKFAAVILHLSKPFCTGLFFTSSELVCTGCKSYWDMLVALHTFKDEFEIAMNQKLYLSSVRIVNIVCSMNLGYPVNLVAAHLDSQLTSDYEPTKFPGEHRQFLDLRTVLKTFPSGSVIATGGTNFLVMAQTFWRAYHIYHKYAMLYHRSHLETIKLMRAKNRHNSANLLQPAHVSQNEASVRTNIRSLFPDLPDLMPAPPSIDELESMFESKEEETKDDEQIQENDPIQADDWTMANDAQRNDDEYEVLEESDWTNVYTPPAKQARIS